MTTADQNALRREFVHAVRAWRRAQAEFLSRGGPEYELARVCSIDWSRFGGLTCGARTRAGTPCKLTSLYDSGRCRLHGGLSTGPRTAAGKAMSAANRRRHQTNPMNSLQNLTTTTKGALMTTPVPVQRRAPAPRQVRQSETALDVAGGHAPPLALEFREVIHANPELTSVASHFRILKKHRLAECLPPASLDEYLAIKRDIAARGILEPIVLYEGAVLDGWKRYCAALSLQIDCPKRILEQTADPISYLVQNSLKSMIPRTTEDQRAIALAMMWEIAGYDI